MLAGEQDLFHRQLQEMSEKHRVESQHAFDGFRKVQLVNSLKHQKDMHRAAVCMPACTGGVL
jgi:hypothetical protein